LEDASSIPLLLRVSPAAKRAKEEKVILGGHPPDPPAGAVPLATPPQKRLPKKVSTCKEEGVLGDAIPWPGKLGVLRFIPPPFFGAQQVGQEGVPGDGVRWPGKLGVLCFIPPPFFGAQQAGEEGVPGDGVPWPGARGCPPPLFFPLLGPPQAGRGNTNRAVLLTLS